jgi:hypothetical protein
LILQFRLIGDKRETAFHGLIPFLLYPERDLPLLYAFRNKGCTGVTSLRGHPGKHRNGQHRRGGHSHSHSHSQPLSDREDKAKDDTCTQHIMLLYLKPNMEREKRKEVHHLIGSMYRDFQTCTKNDLPLPCEDQDGGSCTATATSDMECSTGTNNVTTSAITVQWSKQSQNAWLKRKRKDASRDTRTGTTNSDYINNAFGSPYFVRGAINILYPH